MLLYGTCTLEILIKKNNHIDELTRKAYSCGHALQDHCFHLIQSPWSLWTRWTAEGQAEEQPQESIQTCEPSQHPCPHTAFAYSGAISSFFPSLFHHCLTCFWCHGKWILSVYRVNEYSCIYRYMFLIIICTGTLDHIN